ncbi:hypothetical protein N7468_002000 [Penicillium chermesinum]|uniref:Tautomerase cis-CaaD-like domain-containing protein n=1 Tax=Penicillium chermesinum TaxID=63820 RepID=A0A9W9PKK1_9EURO|nr:uncharacterized protein N7468_002000 [Penicillium chermesinum]KAJ5247017.1 hypothetical protein N7468_002000 [Penicillium chermesinum]
MPLYDVEYVCPLSLSQQEELAQAFTQLHSQRFQTPRVFINVRFTDASSQVVFRGGKRRHYNRVILRSRTSNDRSNELYIEHCRAIVAAWERIVGTGNEVGLRTVWVMGALTTALEAGIARPKTGEEKEWLRVNWPQFKALAEAGDEDFIDLMKEEELLA